MAYINLDVEYWDSKDARRLNARLGRGADAMPPRIWCYVGKHYPETGRLKGYTVAEIEGIAGWWGKAGEAVAALESPEIAVLGKDELGYFVRNWDKHNGHIVSFAVRARKAAEARWSRMQQACLEHASSNAPTLPSVPSKPAEPDPTVRSNGQVRASAEKTEQRPGGLCDFRDLRTKARCSMPREPGSPFCRGHIDWFAERNAGAHERAIKSNGLVPAKDVIAEQLRGKGYP